LAFFFFPGYDPTENPSSENLSSFASLRDLCDFAVNSPIRETQETSRNRRSRLKNGAPYGRDSTAGGAPAGAGLDSSFGIILTIWPSFMTWIGVWVLAATALARAAARIMAWSACWIQLAAFIVGRCC
jgi:hypothetical protein